MKNKVLLLSSVFFGGVAVASPIFVDDNSNVLINQDISKDEKVDFPNFSNIEFQEVNDDLVLSFVSDIPLIDTNLFINYDVTSANSEETNLFYDFSSFDSNHDIAYTESTSTWTVTIKKYNNDGSYFFIPGSNYTINSIGMYDDSHSNIIGQKYITEGADVTIVNDDPNTNSVLYFDNESKLHFYSNSIKYLGGTLDLNVVLSSTDIGEFDFMIFLNSGTITDTTGEQIRVLDSSDNVIDFTLENVMNEQGKDIYQYNVKTDVNDKYYVQFLVGIDQTNNEYVWSDSIQIGNEIIDVQVPNENNGIDSWLIITIVLIIVIVFLSISFIVFYIYNKKRNEISKKFNDFKGDSLDLID